MQEKEQILEGAKSFKGKERWDADKTCLGIQNHQNQVTGWSWRMREEEYRMTWLILSDRVNNATENVCVEQAASEEEHL